MLLFELQVNDLAIASTIPAADMMSMMQLNDGEEKYICLGFSNSKGGINSIFYACIEMVCATKVLFKYAILSHSLISYTSSVDNVQNS